jgi:hypothetical protein
VSDTPESNKAKIAFTSLFANDDAYWVPFKVSCKLERERDEVLSDLEFRRDLFKLQEQQLNDVRAERDRLAAIARELTAMIRVNVMWGRFAECTVEQIDEYLKPWNEKIAAVEGGQS